MNINTYNAEFETDKYIRETFFPDFNYKGIMVEVGAGPPVFYSMSKHFRDCGWRAICVEPNPKFIKQHQKLGNEIHQYACSNFEGETNFKIVSTGSDEDCNARDGISFSAIDIKYEMSYNFPIEEITVNVIKLDTLLDNLNVKQIDFLSIDVEGWEIEVMKGFSVEKFNPKVILLENYKHDIGYIHYMESLNYKLKHTIDYNFIFTK